MSVVIPADKFEQDLTDWLSMQLHSQQLTEAEAGGMGFLLRLSKAQMIDRKRGEEYPFIEAIRLSPEEYQLIEDNGWKQSENLEIKAYCLDLCSAKAKDKRAVRREVSDVYFELYEKTHSPWFLIRSVDVRFYKSGEDEVFLEKVCSAVPAIHGNWLSRVSAKLNKDCKDNLDGYEKALENKLSALEAANSWYDAEAVLDALFALKRMPNHDFHLRKALLHERHFDHTVASQKENEYIMKVDVIQKAFKEICIVKQQCPDVHDRIREKMIKEQKIFAEKLQIFGAKKQYSVPDALVEKVETHLKDNPITTPTDLIVLVKSLKFATLSNVKKLCHRLVKASPMLYMSFGSSMAMGDSGQTIGQANQEESLKIEAHKHFRVQIMYMVRSFLVDFLKREEPFDEESFGQAIMDACKVSYIEESRKLLWAKGIVEGCKGDMIASAHILMPQIERSLVVKAQEYCGDLTHYERDRHDQIPLDKALDAMKPYMKGITYDELSFFLLNGADINFRNRLAHGLMEAGTIVNEGVYLWWLAIKLFFCEKELFLKKN